MLLSFFTPMYGLTLFKIVWFFFIHTWTIDRVSLLGDSVAHFGPPLFPPCSIHSDDKVQWFGNIFRHLFHFHFSDIVSVPLFVLLKLLLMLSLLMVLLSVFEIITLFLLCVFDDNIFMSQFCWTVHFFRFRGRIHEILQQANRTTHIAVGHGCGCVECGGSGYRESQESCLLLKPEIPLIFVLLFSILRLGFLSSSSSSFRVLFFFGTRQHF